MGTDKITLASKEKELIEKVLTKTHWDLEKASKLLQIKPNLLKRKLKTHNIKPSSKTLNPKKEKNHAST